jgi:hypothetical protein
MQTNRWNQIDELFATALELPPDQRATFLETVCAGSDTLRHEVETLLLAHRAVLDCTQPQKSRTDADARPTARTR